MMNPKIFIDQYDDRLQAEEIENEKEEEHHKCMRKELPNWGYTIRKH